MSIVAVAVRGVENDRILPEGQKRKRPNEDQATRMVKHTKLCKYNGCHSVWVGVWGSFIGGRNGRSRFDLTTCAEGRELNH